MPTQTIEINAPQEKVFGYLSDIARHGEWGDPSQGLQVEKTSAGPVGQGSTFRSVGHQFGRQEDSVTVTEYTPNRRIVYESTGKAGVVRHFFTITEQGSGVSVEKGLEIVKAGLPFVIFKPIVTTFIAPGALKRDLERIKVKLEN